MSAIEMGDLVRTKSGAIGVVRKMTLNVDGPTTYVVGKTARPVRHVTLVKSRDLVHAEQVMSETERRVREWAQDGPPVTRGLTMARLYLDSAERAGRDADDNLIAARARHAELLATLPKG